MRLFLLYPEAYIGATQLHVSHALWNGYDSESSAVLGRLGYFALPNRIL